MLVADHRRPLNSIGLPYYRDVLASAWPDLICDVGAPPASFDVKWLATLKPTELGLYGRNTRGLRRNQVDDTRNLHKSVNSGLKAPKFLSEKAREASKSLNSSSDDRADELLSPVAEAEIESKKADVPVMYRNVEIKYSKFGVDDFDFGYVNSHSRYVNDIANPPQILQQNPALWPRDSYFELICQCAIASHAFYTSNPEPCAPARRNCLCERPVFAVRTWFPV